MSNHQSFPVVAQQLNVTETDLRDLEQRNWISSVAKNGDTFLSGRDTFKARFIFHLRRLHLTNDEIGQVLAIQDPPYSLAGIPEILGRPLPVEKPRGV